jgi:hypothetical protein
MRTASQPWTVKVRTDDLPQAGRRVVLTADEATRIAVARQAGVAGIDRLEAAFELTRAGRDGVRVSGDVAATVRQTCVVTLEPIESQIRETVDLAFAPGTPDADGREPAEIAIGPPEPPEPLIGAAVDLGAIATEFLILGIDPYPRKGDAVFEAPPAAAAGSGPFDVLAPPKKADGERR